MSGTSGNSRLLLLALSVAVTGLVVACSNQTERKVDQAQDSAAVAMDKSAEAAGSAAQDAAEVTREAGAAAANSAENTAEAVGEVVEQGGRAADAAVETMDVKTALLADHSVDASRIDVDTDPIMKVVVLKGWVMTAAEKDAAGRIAAKEADGYRVDNQLKVGK